MYEAELEKTWEYIIRDSEVKLLMVSKPEIYEKVVRFLDEIPKKFICLADDFTLENGMLTQTMKLKRRVVFKTYHQAVENLYLQGNSDLKKAG